MRDRTVEQDAVCALSSPAVGEMARRIAAHDWSDTSLGAASVWSETLNAPVRLMLSSQQPMFIAWGPDKTWLYNDALVPIMGLKHPT